MSSRNTLIEEDSQSWITTYADLVTLLLVFFVLLFSMSTIKKEQFAHTIRAFQLALGNADNNGSLIPLPEPLRNSIEQPSDLLEAGDPLPDNPAIQETHPAPKPTDAPVNEDTQVLKELSNNIRDVFSTLGVSDVVDIGDPKDGKIHIRVKGSVLFESGSAAFNRNMLPVMDGVMSVLEKNRGYTVDIQGHTDNIPIETLQFPSNWELSAVRATTVLRYLIRGGISPERLTATGYGESLPIRPNDTPEHQAENRRIEFVLKRANQP